MFPLGLLVALIVSGCAFDRPIECMPGIAAVSEYDYGANIRRLEFDNCTVHTVIEEFRKEWSRALGGKPVPSVAIVDSCPWMTERTDKSPNGSWSPRVTCEFQDIPAWKFLRYLSLMVCSPGVEIVSDELIVLRRPPSMILGYPTKFIRVLSSGQEFLELKRNLSPEALKARLEELGVEAIRAEWNSEQEELILTAEEQESGKVLGWLWLLDNGYSID